jgi:hypothetical protein
MINKFFDILNVRSLVAGRNKRNCNLNPIFSTSDERLSWLVGDFIFVTGKVALTNARETSLKRKRPAWAYAIRPLLDYR